MVAICFYFQVHQPFRIQPYRIKQIGSHDSYFNENSNKEIFQKVARKCYYPSGHLFSSLLKKFPQQLRLTFSLTSTFIERKRND